jgi:hypothetical protein
MSEAIQEVVEPTEHEQAMIDLVDGKEATAQGQADPEKAPEYVEETTPVEVVEEPKAEETPSEESKQGLEITPDPVEEPTEPEEISIDDFLEEYKTNGVLSEESLASLESAGIASDIANSYMAGQIAVARAQEAKVYETVGGPEAYKDMISWAKDNWDASQIEVFNNAINSGDEATIDFGVSALATQFKASSGSPLPKRVISGSSSGTATPSNRFESKADMYKAMNNNLYGKDASYTNMVAGKIANSTF